jgi:hypothetical protein
MMYLFLGDLASLVIGKLLGKTLSLGSKESIALGQKVVASGLVVFLVTITFVYS